MWQRPPQPSQFNSFEMMIYWLCYVMNSIAGTRRIFPMHCNCCMSCATLLFFDKSETTTTFTKLSKFWNGTQQQQQQQLNENRKNSIEMVGRSIVLSEWTYAVFLQGISCHPNFVIGAWQFSSNDVTHVHFCVVHKACIGASKFNNLCIIPLVR